MKKVLLSLFALMMMGKVSADVTISVDNVTLPQNGRTEMTVNFSATGVDRGREHVMEVIQGYTLHLKLPNGITLATDNINNIFCLPGNCYEEGSPSIGVNFVNDEFRFGYYGNPFTNNSGKLFSVILQCEGEFNVGDVLSAEFTYVDVQGLNGSGTSTPIGETGSDFYDSQVIANDFTITISEPLTTVELDEDSEVAPVASDGKVDVHVQRTINANEWSTICLPFAMTAAQVKEAFGDEVKLGDFTGYVFTAASGDNTVDHITINFKDTIAIAAHHPYIIKVTNPVEEFTVEGVTIDIDNETYPCIIKTNGETRPIKIKYGYFIGNYISNFDFYSSALDEVGYTPLFLSGNKFWYASEDTQTMKAFRAYFVLQQEAPDMDPAETRVDLNFNDGEATGISSVQTLAADGLYYNLNGQAVERPAKGLYIHNGKKVILK